MQCFALSTLTFRTTPRQVYSYKTKIQKSTVFSWPLTSSYCLTPGPSYHQRDHEQIKLDDSLLMSLMSRTSKPWGFAALFKINSQKNSPSPSHGVFLTWMLVRFLIFSWLMDRNILDVKKKGDAIHIVDQIFMLFDRISFSYSEGIQAISSCSQDAFLALLINGEQSK